MKAWEFSIRYGAAMGFAIAALVSVLIACGGGGDGGGAGAGGTGGSFVVSQGGSVGSGGSPATPAELTDGEIFQVLDYLNAGEVQQAGVALVRSQRADVKEYAQMLSDQHTEAAAQGKALAQKQAITFKANSVATTVQAKSRVLVDQLTSSPDQEFDALYIASEVSAHDEAILLIDVLHSAADDAALKTWIADLKGELSAHAMLAKAL